MPRLDRWALGVVASSIPVRVALASTTDLSPDEAYYLCAARLGHLVPDHPPLTVWMLRASDSLSGLPVELRTRLGPLVLSTLTSLVLLDWTRRQCGSPSSQRWISVLASWLALPLAGGFLATPDSPFGFALALLLLLELSRRTGPGMMVLGATIGALGVLAKASFLPAAAIVALGSQKGLLYRFGVAAGAAAALPFCFRSTQFQLHHAFGVSTWSAFGALLALAATASAQLALWTPAGLALGFRRLTSSNRLHQALVGGFGALVAVSAVTRALPAEPNWLVPAALVLILEAARALPAASTTVRASVLMMGPALVVVFASHVVRPWLPLATHLDPSARLHGWKSERPPIGAPGIGDYGATAEACIYGVRGSSNSYK